MTNPDDLQLWRHLPPKGVAKVDPDDLLSRFLAWVSAKGLSLYPAQEEAILELFAGKHVILNTPTGSGKSLVAEALHFKALAEGKSSFYTCPIKALANEKFFALCESFGPENVGMMTGDASVNRDALIICCTAEVLSNLCLGEEAAYVDYVVMDEFHYYADKERGTAWQVPLLSLPRAGFLLMSATLGTTEHIEEGLKELTGRDIAVIRNVERPVPLEYSYVETPLHETIAELIEQNRYPIYLVNFTQRAAAEQAQNLTSVNLCTKPEKEAIREQLFDAKFDTPYGKDLEKYLKHGIGLHHAGLLPKYRRLTERLAQKGMLKVVSGTDTLGMGVNIPIRTVLFTQLCKFDGEKVGILPVRDFHQIAGRAGRKGFDEKGYVVAQAPEHVIENKKLELKAAAGKKVQKKQPPTKGYAHFDKQTFERLLTKQPEPLEPRFQVTHGLLLTLLMNGDVWPRGGYGRLVELVSRSHGNDYTRRKHKLKAAQAFRALRNAGLVSVERNEGRRASHVKVSEDLQHDFSLMHTLSLYLLSVLNTLDPMSETYALDVLTMCEAILEDPKAVLFKQIDKMKEQKLNEMKAAGIPYEERIEELDKVQPPRPLAEFIWGTFSAFAEKHPWVGGEDIRPKSVARDLIERLTTFNEYVKEYGLQRSEGVLLRYLAEAYKTIAHSVPDSARNEAVEDVTAYLRELVRTTDSSLLEEWEEMGDEPITQTTSRKAPTPLKVRSEMDRLLADPKAFASRVRTDLHLLLRALGDMRWGDALAMLFPLEGEEQWTEEKLAAAFTPFLDAHGKVDLTPKARMPHNTVLTSLEPKKWEAVQKLLAPDGTDDWMLDCIIDAGVGRPEGAPLLSLRRIGT